MSGIIADLDSSKMNHILLEAEMKGLICSGKIMKKMATFALVEERLNNFNVDAGFDKEAALERLARKYFLSHGPATLPDFIWWSGLSAGDCRKALSMVKDRLRSEKVGNAEYWYDEAQNENELEGIPEIALLPAFDEFIIAYKDRSSVLTLENHGIAVSSNGVFRPVVVYEGQVIGLWNKAIKKDTMQVSFNWFIKPGKPVLEKLKSLANQYAHFLGLKKSETI